MPEVTVMYTDGACSGNPGPGGWGAIAHLSNGQIHEIGGAEKATTNNRMEIQAAIEILQWFADSPQTKAPVLYTDSKYVQDGITKWIKGWKKKNWKTTAGKPVLNQDLWRQLDAVTQTVNAKLATPVQWRYVKGHAGNEGNERCDAIARDFSKGRHPALMTVTPWAKEERSLASAAVPDVTASTQPENQRSSTVDQPTESSSDPATTPAPKQVQTSTNPTPETLAATAEITSKHQGASSESTGAASDGIMSASELTLKQMIERIRIADEIATNGYWITTSELAQLLHLPTANIEEKGKKWLWRNWSVQKVNQGEPSTLWQLERID